jgi:2-methylcitrate dehydratase
MAAIPLIFGRLTAEDYEDGVAADPRVDALRNRMAVKENEKFTRDYYDAGKRYIGNAIQVFFKDGSKTERVEIEFPIGHRKRRVEGIPVLIKKFESAIAGRLPVSQCTALKAICSDQQKLEQTPVTEFMQHWVV